MTSEVTPSTTPEAALDLLLRELEDEERLVSNQRRILFERIDVCIDDRHRERFLAQEREVSARRRELHARIDALRAERDALAVSQNVPADAEAPPARAQALLESAAP